MFGCTCVLWKMLKSEDIWKELVLFSYHVGSSIELRLQGLTAGTLTLVLGVGF